MSVTTHLTSHIVVDASIARSVGDPASHPVAAACLAFIRALEKKECLTGALMTPALRAEWRTHASRVATSWLVTMENKGRLRKEPDKPVRGLRAAIKSVEDDGIRSALVKDLHLSEAAIVHGVPVASRDEKQRAYLGDLSADYPAVGRIQWLNPAAAEAPDWQSWLEEGCSNRDSFKVRQ